MRFCRRSLPQLGKENEGLTNTFCILDFLGGSAVGIAPAAVILGSLQFYFICVGRDAWLLCVYVAYNKA